MAIVIVVLSLINNWLVQLVYYFRTKSEHVGQRTLLNYYTGFLGDGVIAPLVNVLVFYIFVSIRFRPDVFLILVSFLAALVLDFLIHYFQGKLKMVNWSMREPFKWNFAGKWHMISLPIQVTYLLLFFIALWVNTKEIFLNPATTVAADGVFLLMAVFVRLALRDHWWI